MRKITLKKGVIKEDRKDLGSICSFTVLILGRALKRRR